MVKIVLGQQMLSTALFAASASRHVALPSAVNAEQSNRAQFDCNRVGLPG